MCFKISRTFLILLFSTQAMLAAAQAWDDGYLHSSSFHYNSTLSLCATDRQGTWLMASTTSYHTPQNIWIRLSTNNGASWNDRVAAVSGPSFKDINACVSDAGTWLLFYTMRRWGNSDFGISRSTDRARNWSETVFINSDWASDTFYDEDGRLASAGGSNWVATWVRQTGFESSSPYTVFRSRSVNDGATWSSPVPLDEMSNATSETLKAQSPKLACSNDGSCLAIWMRVPPGDWNQRYFVYSTSSDAGNTWGPVLTLPGQSIGSFPRQEAEVSTNGHGKWMVVVSEGGNFWKIETQDLGATWSEPQVILSGQSENLWYVPFCLENDRADNWVLFYHAWSSTSEDGTVNPTMHSMDDGATWSPAQKPLVVERPGTGVYTGRTLGTLAADGYGRWMASCSIHQYSYCGDLTNLYTCNESFRLYTFMSNQTIAPPANDPPIALDQMVVFSGRKPVPFTLKYHDPENAALALKVVQMPHYGSLSGTAPELVYQPFSRSKKLDHFQYTVSDVENESDPATVLFAKVRRKVAADPVVALNQQVETQPNTSIDVRLYGHSSTGKPIEYTVLRSPRNGVVSGEEPHLVYTPNRGFKGRDHLIWVATSPDGTSRKARVSIRVR